MSNTFTKTSLRGFTLIELLVVIAIIGLLSTAIMGPVQTGLKKGRDTRKISDISQIQGGLIQFAGDNNGKYPDYLIAPNGSASTVTFLASTTPTYMVPDAKMLGGSPAGGLTKLPAARDRFNYVVYKDTAGNIVSYHLGTALENQNASLQGDADCGNGDALPGEAISAVPAETTKACDSGAALLVGNYSNYVAVDDFGNPNEATDFGGKGLKESANDVCASTLDTCIFDVTPN